MKKNIAVVISVLLISLLSLSLAQSTSKNFVAATIGNAVFCPNNVVPGLDTEYEITLSSATCFAIANLLNNRNNVICYWMLNATLYDYLGVLDILDTNYNPEIVFSKGHNVPWNDGTYYRLIEHNGDPNYVRDSDIFDYTSDRFAFVFLWHCGTAESYPPGQSGGTYLEQGHGYCWTHNPNMYLYTNGGSQVFLGWNWTSPQFETDIYYGSIYNYAQVAYYFWAQMCDGYTVDETLTFLATELFETWDFEDTALYSRYVNGNYSQLQVWGNMAMYLP